MIYLLTPMRHPNQDDLMKVTILQVQICKHKFIKYTKISKVILKVSNTILTKYTYYPNFTPYRYDPNYDLLKKPASHYSQATNHVRYQDHLNYPISPNQESTYTSSPQSPPSAQHQTQYQMRRPYDTQHLSLPLTNTVTDKLDNSQPSTSMYQNNQQSPYIDRNRSQQQIPQENVEQTYDRQSQRNIYLQDTIQGEITPKNNDMHVKNSRTNIYEEKHQSVNTDATSESRSTSKGISNQSAYNKDVYGESSSRSNRSGTVVNERSLIDRRTPDAYSRSAMAAYSKGKMGDYEDLYGQYTTENEYGKTYPKSPNPVQDRDNVSISSHQQQQKQTGSHVSSF